jgi:predicted DNA-binding helix-hairpin-helix protein
MNTVDKLQLLADASQYDLSCACGTKNKDHRTRGADGTWLYPVSLPRGGYSVMLKTLVSNVCTNDCKYCPYRSTVDVPRCTIGPDEIAQTFLEYVRKKQVFGLFLSSGVVGTPDRTMELLTDAAGILRCKYHYKGYIHLKIIPGASDAAIEKAISLSSAVSLNIETPGIQFFQKLSSKKDYVRDIIAPLKYIDSLTSKGTKYEKVKKTTQFIVGASDENDKEIIRYTGGLYSKLNFNRVYFSVYQRGLGDTSIPGEYRERRNKEDDFTREHRLYQVDFLLRKYQFNPSEIIFNSNGMLSLESDPKRVWAESHPEYFPVNVNRATKIQLLRIPGIGPETVRKIVSARKQGKINRIDDLPFRGKRLEYARAFMVFN